MFDPAGPGADVAAGMGMSRTAAHKWMRLRRDDGEAGLTDRSQEVPANLHRSSLVSAAQAPPGDEDSDVVVELAAAVGDQVAVEMVEELVGRLAAP